MKHGIQLQTPDEAINVPTSSVSIAFFAAGFGLCIHSISVYDCPSLRENLSAADQVSSQRTRPRVIRRPMSRPEPVHSDMTKGLRCRTLGSAIIVNRGL